MLTVIATMKPKPGSENDFERSIADLFEDVRGEPGCAGVIWGKRADGEGYGIIERYHDEAALQAHQQSKHMAEKAPGVTQLLDGPPLFHIINEF